jgi:hypothetical protein
MTERFTFFERGVFTQEHVDRFIADGWVPVYRDPAHPPDYATMVGHHVGRPAVWAHPSMPLRGGIIFTPKKE